MMSFHGSLQGRKKSLEEPRQGWRAAGEPLAPLNRPGSESRGRQCVLARCHGKTSFTGKPVFTLRALGSWLPPLPIATGPNVLRRVVASQLNRWHYFSDKSCTYYYSYYHILFVTGAGENICMIITWHCLMTVQG